MIDRVQFTTLIIEPVLEHLNMSSTNALILMLGTALVESNLTYVKQLGKGPALSLYQIEPRTHHDQWDNYLSYRPELAAKVSDFMIPGLSRIEQLKGNLYYATAIARIKYWRVSEPLPRVDDPAEMAKYHKSHYNTTKGKTKTSESVLFFKCAKDTVLSIKKEKYNGN